MKRPSEYIKDLLKKHIEHRASPAEVETLLAALDLYEEEAIVQMLDEIDPDINPDTYRNRLEPPPYRELRDRIGIIPPSKSKTARRLISTFSLIAVGCAVLAFALGWFFGRPPKLQYSCGDLSGTGESPTGVYSCRLILGNGCSILIDSTYKGEVARQGNTQIIKLPAGILLYKNSSGDLPPDSLRRLYNTVTTSGGDQYQVVLPDGTRVRLNAASSIRFPLVFSDTERELQLEGEAYFDVAPDEKAPFSVRVGNTEIRASGTGFNLNAYSANTIATLVSGSLEIKNGEDRVQLKPGQEAIVRGEKTAGIFTGRADTAGAVSWKKLVRVYKNVPLKDFVSDIGRWFNFEMENTGCIPDRVFSASLCYDTPAPELLKLLRSTGLHFKQEGRRIIFYPASG